MSLSSNPPSETLRERVNITGSTVNLTQSMYLMQEYQGVMQASSCMNREECSSYDSPKMIMLSYINANSNSN